MQISLRIKSFLNLFKTKAFYAFVGIVSILIVADLWTKSLVFSLNQNGIYICSFLNIFQVRNYGISFGLFSNNPAVLFYFISIFDVIIIAYLIWLLFGSQKYKKPKLFFVSISLIVGGAFGNLIDRIIYKSVRDFIDFHIGIHHWPCFNFADAVICIGAFLWIVCELFYHSNANNGKNNSK